MADILTRFQHVSVTDRVGVVHDVSIRQDSEDYYVARTIRCDSYFDGKTPERAVADLLGSINWNHSSQFNECKPEKKERMVTWIRTNLRAGTRGKAKRYSSYYLKHIVEEAIGQYVGNGELKGAMLEAGLLPTKDSEEYNTNCGYVLQRGLKREGER